MEALPNDAYRLDAVPEPAMDDSMQLYSKRCTFEGFSSVGRPGWDRLNCGCETERGGVVNMTMRELRWWKMMMVNN